AGKPVSGAKVRIIDLPAGEQVIVAIPDRFTSDRKGEFVFHAPDDALLEARAAGHGPGRARLDGKAQTSHRLVIRLPPAGGPADQLGAARISGSVVDAGGDPLPGVVVRAEPAGRKGEESLLVAAARAITGDDGRFTLSGLDAGLYALEAVDGVRAPAHADVDAVAGQTATVRLEMAAGAVLRGAVEDARGEPVPAFTVVVFRSDGLARVPVAVRTVVDREGSFALEGLGPGGYRVQATAHGHAPSRPADGRAEVPPDRAPPVTISLPDGGTLTGVVKSAQDGRPLENARVSVEGGVGEGPTPVPFAASAITDARGEFALRGLSPGRRSVFVGAYNHHATILGGLEIAEGAVLGPVEVVLTPVAEGEEPTVELAGIGAVLAAEGDALVVQKILPGGGAEKAGLTAGDAIVSVDGAPVIKLGMEGAIQAIRGPVGSTVALAVRKAGQGDPVTMVVERMKIRA
ncbi:MAG TPA: carboxypeptidase regulatory-like domain-containing protein, partial [Kofleriaceae bacterium]|nr:carboxypeptidase regulatory-like domain-containing protein [Kofleriaceae bacterium]